MTCLPDDIRVESRLILDNCSQLESLPEGLTCGSISLRGCGYFSDLPEGLSTWFLDLTDCRRFSCWPNFPVFNLDLIYGVDGQTE